MASSVWQAQAMQGSKEWTVRKTSSGFDWVGYGVSEQRGFVRSGNTALVARAGIPGGGHHGLVVGENALVDNHPMGKVPRGASCIPTPAISIGGIRADCK